MTGVIDILIPKDNEEKLLEMAKKLGYDSICFLYDRIGDKTKEKIAGLGKKNDVHVYFGSVYGNPANRQSDVVLGDVEKINAADAIVDKRIDAVFGFEKLKASDRTHHKVSGLDHVLCTMAAEKKKIIVIDFGHILKAKGHARAVMIGRIKQNIMLCKKYKAKVAIASFASSPLHLRSPHDLASFIDVLGGDERKALVNFEEKIMENIKKRSPDYIAEGIEKV